MSVKYLLISNMWPSEDAPGYGSFVKNVVDGLSTSSFECKYRAVIVGRPKSFFDKLCKYILFYIHIVKYYFAEYDFVYIHFPNQALPVLIPLFCIKKKKIVINLHGEDLIYKEGGLSGILGKMNDWFMKKAIAIVVPSDYYKNVTIQRINCDPNMLVVSPSGGINPSYFYNAKYNKQHDTNIIHIGYVGRIDPNKGWRQFIDVVRLLPEGFNFKATIIGTGSEIDDLKKAISSLKPRTVSHILHVQQHELRKYYTQFDLFIFPTMRKEESLGLVGIEAMACGVPVIGSDIGGIPSYLTDGYNGFLVPPGDVFTIANRIVTFSMLSHIEKERMVNNCLERSQLYYAPNVISNLAERLNTILN